MKSYLLLLLIPVLSGCFEDKAELPQYYAKQQIDVAVDSVICFSAQEDFSHFILTCSEPFDSVHWYMDELNNVFLQSGQPLEMPNVPYGWTTIKCLGFSNSDTTEFQVSLSYCTRDMYIPMAFSPNADGKNDNWFPVYYSTDDGLNFQSYTVHWEIRTLDGIKVFEADDFQQKWDGLYNGESLPNGSYLYYIELTISGEDPVEYTGWLEMLG